MFAAGNNSWASFNRARHNPIDTAPPAEASILLWEREYRQFLNDFS
jgi:hypothetical protein